MLGVGCWMLGGTGCSQPVSGGLYAPVGKQPVPRAATGVRVWGVCTGWQATGATRRALQTELRASSRTPRQPMGVILSAAKNLGYVARRSPQGRSFAALRMTRSRVVLEALRQKPGRAGPRSMQRQAEQVGFDAG